MPATSRPLKALLTWLDADSNHACAYITADGALYMCHLTEQHGALVQPPRLLYRADELRAAAQMQLSPDQGRLIVFTSHDLALEFDLIRQHPQNPLQYSLGISSLVCAWDRTGGNRIAVFDKKRRRVAVIDSIKVFEPPQRNFPLIDPWLELAVFDIGVPLNRQAGLDA